MLRFGALWRGTASDNSMALDQVRQASKVLGPLLRRRGTSPALGASLRRGLQALDKAFSGLSAQALDETVTLAIAELDACVGLIRESACPADHEQLAGIEKALALLAPAAVAIPAVPTPDTVPSPQHAQAARGPSPPSPKARARSKVPLLDTKAAGTLLAGYEAGIETVGLVVSEPMGKLVDLDAAYAVLQKRTDALKWLGKERAPEILRVADEASGLVNRLAAGAALVHLGDVRGAEMLMGLLGKAAAEKQPLPDASAIFLRTIADDALAQWMLQVFNLPAHPTVCGLLLPLLAERKLLPPDRIWQLLEHAKDEVAVAAAQALPWSDGVFDLPILIARAEHARTARRANALLFAATVLGSGQALAQVRARLVAMAEPGSAWRSRDAGRDGNPPRGSISGAMAEQGGGGVDGLLVDALAVAGDASDALLLTRLAGRFEEDAPTLLLAAANLGSVEVLAALPELDGSVPADVLSEVRRMIAGPAEARARNPENLRMLRGRPWSVSRLLACLAAPDETLQARRQMALELRARTGEVPSGALPLLPPSARTQLLADWNACYAKADGRMEAGRWYYQGKPMGVAAREMA